MSIFLRPIAAMGRNLQKISEWLQVERGRAVRLFDRGSVNARGRWRRHGKVEAACWKENRAAANTARCTTGAQRGIKKGIEGEGEVLMVVVVYSLV
jgi:hypothetical protein